MKRTMIALLVLAATTSAAAAPGQIRGVNRCNHPHHGGQWVDIGPSRWLNTLQECWDQAYVHRDQAQHPQSRCSTVNY